LRAGLSGPREVSGGDSCPVRKAGINGVLVRFYGFIKNLPLAPMIWWFNYF
jgi:hypothetical protein